MTEDQALPEKNQSIELVSNQSINNNSMQLPPFGQFGNGIQQPLEYSTTVLVLGILSFFGYCFYVLPGLILGIIALILAKKGQKLYYLNPNLYTISSFKNLNAGKICAIIGIALVGIIVLLFAAYAILYSMSDLKD